MTIPPRKKADDFDPEVLRLFDQYVHGLMDRRGFLAGATCFAVGATTAAGLLAALAPQFAAALRRGCRARSVVTHARVVPARFECCAD